MSHIRNLISFHIVERENNQNFLTWTYPTLAEDHENYILQNCFDQQTGCFCLRKNNVYFYFQQEVKFAIILLTRDFEPNKYKTVCDIFTKEYIKNQHPVELVKLYISLFSTGTCSVNHDKSVYSCNLKNFKPVTNLKEFIQSFDLEIILIYNAILLKRRTLFYSDNLEQLQRELLTVTNLVPCRKVDDYLQPLINSPKKLKGLSFYVAGTTNPDLLKNEGLYDIFVNLQAREITISSRAEEIMAMSKIHKDIATLLVKLASSELSEVEVKQQIGVKTSDVISSLKNLASVTTENNVKMLTVSALKSKNMQAALENFLFNLALAENMMML